MSFFEQPQPHFCLRRHPGAWRVASSSWSPLTTTLATSTCNVGAALFAIAKGIRVLSLPGLPPKGDVVDWLAAATTRSSMKRPTGTRRCRRRTNQEETDEADQKAEGGTGRPAAARRSWLA